MARMRRPRLSDKEKAELWKHWQAGQSLSKIGVALGKHAGSIHGVVSLKRGISPTARKRSPRRQTLREREQISRGQAKNMSMRATAKRSWPICLNR